MVRPHLRWLVPAAFLAAAAGAPAQPTTPPARPDPLNPQASVPPLQHASAFAAYRRQGDIAAADWKAANDTVGRIGGWRSYAREAHPPAAPARPASAVGAAQ